MADQIARTGFLRSDGTSIYDHLNERNPLSVRLDMDALARMVEESNYWIVRLFAAIIRVRRDKLVNDKDRREHIDVCHGGNDPIIAALERLLRGEAF